MELKQLRALLAVAETGSVTKAAELLHLVQPAVSRQLMHLEEGVGAPLFHRERHGMELTDAGRILVEHARRALRELEQATAEIQPARGVVAGVVNVGLLPSTCDLLGGDLAAQIKERYPQVQLRLTTAYAGHLRQWLENGEVDLTLLYNPQNSPALDIRPLLDERLYLVGTLDSGLRMAKAVPLSALRAKPLILPSAPHGIRVLVEHACAVAKIGLTIAAEANEMSLQKLLVARGLGYTVLPGAAMFDDLARGSLAAAPITRPNLQRRVVLALPATRRTSTAVRVVSGALIEIVIACVSSGRWAGAKVMA